MTSETKVKSEYRFFQDGFEVYWRDGNAKITVTPRDELGYSTESFHVPIDKISDLVNVLTRVQHETGT